MQKILKTLKWAGVFLYFSLLIIGMTYPLILKMDHAIIGEIGDNIYFVWMIGWMKKALFDLHTNPFNVWFLNYPEGWNMAYTEITPIMLALAMPFTFVGGATFGYNAAMLLTFILAGLFMTVWIKHLTGRMDAALIGGTIYAFVPYHFAHFLIGHLNQSGIQWFPLFFMGLYDMLKEPVLANGKINWKSGLLAGISLGLIAWTSQYYLYMTFFISLVFIIGYPLITGWRKMLGWPYWKNLLVLGGSALPLVGIAVLPYVTLAQSGGLPDRSIGITEMYSASPTDFVLPSTLHPLWGQWVGATFNRDMWIEGTLYIGIIAFILALTAVLGLRKSQHRPLIILAVTAALLAVLLAMGIDLHWNGQAVKVSLPFLMNGQPVPIPLPGYFLFKYFPLFAKLRALMRFGVFTLVMTGLLAGLGASWFLERFKPRWQPLVCVFIILLVLVDFSPRPFTQFSEVSARPLDAWLAAQPGDGALIQLPIDESDDQQQTYNTLTHGKPFVGGFFNAFPPAQYGRIRPTLETFPDRAGIDLLKDLGVEYILVDIKAYSNPELVKQQCLDLGLTLRTEMDGQWVFGWR